MCKFHPILLSIMFMPQVFFAQGDSPCYELTRSETRLDSYCYGTFSVGLPGPRDSGVSSNTGVGLVEGSLEAIVRVLLQDGGYLIQSDNQIAEVWDQYYTRLRWCDMSPLEVVNDILGQLSYEVVLKGHCTVLVLTQDVPFGSTTVLGSSCPWWGKDTDNNQVVSEFVKQKLHEDYFPIRFWRDRETLDGIFQSFIGGDRNNYTVESYELVEIVRQ